MEKLYCNQCDENILNCYFSESNFIDEDCLNIGFGLLEMGYPEDSLKYLNSAKAISSQKNIGKIQRYIGLANYLLGNYEKSKIAFEVGRKDDQECIMWTQLMFPTLYEIHEMREINFYFIDRINQVNKKLFMLKTMKAFERIKRTIGRNYCEKKIDIYIYAGRYDTLGNSLSYADNGLKMIQTSINEVNGHEIAHIMFNSIYKHMVRNRFIDEGIATFFSEEIDFSYYLKRYCRQIPLLNVYELWNGQQNDVFNGILEFYYFAGAFVGYLIYVYGIKRFIEFISDESIEHAREIFGTSIDREINQFHRLIQKEIQIQCRIFLKD